MRIMHLYLLHGDFIHCGCIGWHWQINHWGGMQIVKFSYLWSSSLIALKARSLRILHTIPFQVTVTLLHKFSFSFLSYSVLSRVIFSNIWNQLKQIWPHLIVAVFTSGALSCKEWAIAFLNSQWQQPAMETIERIKGGLAIPNHLWTPISPYITCTHLRDNGMQRSDEILTNIWPVSMICQYSAPPVIIHVAFRVHGVDCIMSEPCARPWEFHFKDMLLRWKRSLPRGIFWSKIAGCGKNMLDSAKFC